jgi:hypothetical protein
MTDSPAGLAAGIGEKFHVWTDHGGDHEAAVSRDHLHANNCILLVHGRHRLIGLALLRPLRPGF